VFEINFGETQIAFDLDRRQLEPVWMERARVGVDESIVGGFEYSGQ